MNIDDLQAEINAIDQETAQINSSGVQSLVKKFLNIIERLAGENDSLKSKNQNLSDEINRLKGEQGKPDIKANKKKEGNISSRKPRRMPIKTLHRAMAKRARLPLKKRDASANRNWRR
jgi:predicted RNase H-like nuclease (RuvC/YqgF family)